MASFDLDSPMASFRWFAVCTVLLAVACGSSPSSPTTNPPPGGEPSASALVCPAGISQLSVDGRAVTISYPPPTLNGQPIDKGVCSPPPGSPFPAGQTTNVTCQATEAPSLAAACSFTVDITIPPRTSKVRLMAFGDSLTEGAQGVGAIDFRNAFPPVVVPSQSYPAQLQHLLTMRYPVQDPLVFNRGVGGELANEGRQRLPAELDIFQPDVLLLLEGVNDINEFIVLSPGVPVRVDSIAGDLHDMVQIARQRGVAVLLATLTPVTAGREHFWPGLQAGINDLNEQIRAIAAAESLGPVVDLFAALDGNPALISADGLHPSAAGYAVIAQAFLDAIASRFETTPAPKPSTKSGP